MRPLQLLRAWRLARGHAHEWACAIDMEEVPGIVRASGGDPRRVRARIANLTEARRQPPDGLAGITAPTWVGDTIDHTTRTGRVRWWIWSDGWTVVHVSRPTGVILQWYLDGDRRDHWLMLVQPDVIRERHRAALLRCLDALGVWPPHLSPDGLRGRRDATAWRHLAAALPDDDRPPIGEGYPCASVGY